MTEPMLLTVAEAREVSGLPRDLLSRLIRERRIRVIKSGGRRLLIPRIELERFIAREARLLST
jgi:excisionase family DNA binding protein